jgi:hypothetical protein
MVRVLGVVLAIGMAIWAIGGCGGAAKPPMQPDVDTTSLADGGPEMTPPAAPAPATSK